MSDDDVKRYNESKQLKNWGAVVVFAVVFGVMGFLGIGHIFIGKARKGFTYLILGFVACSVIIFGLVGLELEPDLMTFQLKMIVVAGTIIFLILFIHQAISARNDCNDFNEYYIRTKNRLW